MQQMSFLDGSPLHAITNVATVPQRSPFRYPGGKTWLVPRIRQWLAHRPARPELFVEPFAGGGIVSLTVGFEHLADHVIMVEVDAQVAAVWKTILGDGAARDWPAERIATFDLTPEAVAEVLARPAIDIKEQAFRTILKNRVNHGGIMAAGAGKIKQGENGRGLRSRWYPATLCRRIQAIGSIRERFTFIAGDGMHVLRRYADQPGVVCFLDPPYTAAGKKAGARLYTHADLDHSELFRLAGSLAGDFIMTYDNTPEIHALAHAHGFDTQLVAMKNTHHAAMTELIIGRCLDWLR